MRSSTTSADVPDWCTPWSIATTPVEARRHALLDQYEADGQSDLRPLAGALVRPLAAELGATGGPGYLQLLADLATRPHPAIAAATIEDPTDSTFRWRAAVEPCSSQGSSIAPTVHRDPVHPDRAGPTRPRCPRTRQPVVRQPPDRSGHRAVGGAGVAETERLVLADLRRSRRHDDHLLRSRRTQPDLTEPDPRTPHGPHDRDHHTRRAGGAPRVPPSAAPSGADHDARRRQRAGVPVTCGSTARAAS